MRSADYVYEVLEKQLHQRLHNKQFGKRAHGKFFFRCVNHLQLCHEPNCCIRALLEAFVANWEIGKDPELIASVILNENSVKETIK
jgi:hypothetical protein